MWSIPFAAATLSAAAPQAGARVPTLDPIGLLSETEAIAGR